MPRAPLKVMISSTAYGFEGTLRQMDAVLRQFGYDVLNNEVGSIISRPGQSVPQACLEAVDNCDYFLGIIRGNYGTAQQEQSGLTDAAISVTHLEQRRATALDKPRMFFAERKVDFARLALKPILKRIQPNHVDTNGHLVWDLPLAAGETNPFRGTPMISDLRVIAMLEEAQRGSGGAWTARYNNWCQRFDREDEILRSLTALFRDEGRLRADLNDYNANP